MSVSNVAEVFQREGNYVRVSGTLKTYGSKRYINTAHIRLLKDWPEHELFFHIAETMAVTLMFDRGPVSKCILVSELFVNVPLARTSHQGLVKPKMFPSDRDKLLPLRTPQRRTP